MTRLLAALLSLLGACDGREARAQAPAPIAGAEAASELRAEAQATVLRVVDGDTLEVAIDGEPGGEPRMLRLLSVDTEEKISGRASASTTKPETVFGEETAQWARSFFAELGSPARVGLAFPEGGREDAYGRLLCHVLLPDGRDFNLLLVETGRSPYFDKYGYSLVAHAAFERAEAEARERRLGIWDPATNRARGEGAPSAVRPYERLLPWWDARAAAVDSFRARATAGETAGETAAEIVVAADDPAGLRAARERCERDPVLRVTVFGEIERFYEESDGALTALLAAGGPDIALRAAIAREERAALEPLLRASTAELRQNYLFATGRLERNPRGFVLVGSKRTDWTLAGPEVASDSAR